MDGAKSRRSINRILKRLFPKELKGTPGRWDASLHLQPKTTAVAVTFVAMAKSHKYY